MKKALLILILAGGAFAEEWYNSYASGIAGSHILANVGVGFGILPYKLSVPPISASVEYMLDKIPLSLGGYFGIAGYKEDLIYSTYTGTMVGIGARAAWHVGFVKNLDVYGGLNLGWMVYTQEIKSPGISAIKNDLSAFYYTFFVGGRYFFTKNIGAYVELGYSPISIVSAGLSLKF